MSRVYLDSMVWIYALEANEHFGRQAQEILSAIRRGPHVLLASNFILAEVLVAPLRDKNTFLSTAYRRAIRGRETELVSFNLRTALAFATIRGQYRVKPPDAVHLALAATASTDLFITVDDRLKRVEADGIRRVVDLNEALLML